MNAGNIAALAVLGGAVITALFAYLASRDSRALGLINASQDVMKAAITQQAADLTAARHELTAARREIATMHDQLKAVEGELTTVLEHHEECERVRDQQAAQIIELQRQIAGKT